MNSKRYALYIYGSTARGDAVEDSDVDVLVVMEDKNDVHIQDIPVPETAGLIRKKPDLSYYSVGRLRSMYRSGHLFAWHLYNEAKFLEVGTDYLSELGKPRNYESFDEDTTPLFDLLCSIKHELAISRDNLIYEAGLVYVCTRNIAMCASYFTSDGLTFSAYAPYMLGYSDNPFPLPRERFDTLRRARLAGTRGLEAWSLDGDVLLEDLQNVQDWAYKELTRIKRLSAQ
ncbi:MAG TPA: nucleotidyltransferase domain-containing protein [Acidiferrobacterales bacterium]|jgi:hypothetical protein